MLVVHPGRTVSAEQIIESLWEDKRPASAFAGLQSYVSHLRRRLEPDVAARSRSGVIVRQARGYAVRLSPGAVDAWRFERLVAPVGNGGDPVDRLTQALRLWRVTLTRLAEVSERATTRTVSSPQVSLPAAPWPSAPPDRRPVLPCCARCPCAAVPERDGARTTERTCRRGLLGMGHRRVCLYGREGLAGPRRLGRGGPGDADEPDRRRASERCDCAQRRHDGSAERGK
jgi:Transcriptional regulatory protein, C terminal